MRPSGRKSKDAVMEIGGTALKVYLYMMMRDREVGVRELQRAFGFKSPSTAKHHLDRLVELGLAEKTTNGYRAVSSSRILRLSLLSVFNRIIPLDLFLGIYGLLSIITYLILFFDRLSELVLPLLIPVAVLSLFLLYRGVSLYGIYRDGFTPSPQEEGNE